MKSAGTEPAGKVHPEVLVALAEVGIDASNAPSQLLTKELAEPCALLVTMGCGEKCPYVPGLKHIDWALMDPKGKTVEEVRAIREQVKGLVEELVKAEGWSK